MVERSKEGGSRYIEAPNEFQPMSYKLEQYLRRLDSLTAQHHNQSVAWKYGDAVSFRRPSAIAFEISRPINSLFLHIDAGTLATYTVDSDHRILQMFPRDSNGHSVFGIVTQAIQSKPAHQMYLWHGSLGEESVIDGGISLKMTKYSVQMLGHGNLFRDDEDAFPLVSGAIDSLVASGIQAPNPAFVTHLLPPYSATPLPQEMPEIWQEEVHTSPSPELEDTIRWLL